MAITLDLDKNTDLRKGVQTPRYSHHPLYFTTAADDAIDLAAVAGFNLMPWQEYVLRNSLGEKKDGSWESFVNCLVIPRQQGKNPVDINTRILTTDGWTTFKDIRPGQYVYDMDGKPVRVKAITNIFPAEGDHYKVSFTDGAEYIADGDHLWHVRHKDRNRYQDIPTREIAKNFGGVRPDNGRNEYNYRVRCDTVPQTPEADLPIDPYLFGAWLGDGTARSSTITCGAQDVEWMIKRLTECEGVSHVDQWVSKLGVSVLKIRMSSGDPLQVRLRNLGVLGEKYIPEVYLTASPEQRMSLLRGLLDTDGSITTDGKSRVELSSSYPKLAEGMHRLIRSLGIRVTPRVGASYCQGERKRDRTRFVFSPLECPFEMPRKAEHWVKPTGKRHEVMSITNVERVAPVETRCITIDDPRGVFLIGDLFTPTHNCIIEVRQLAGMFIFGEGVQTHTAHEAQTASKAQVALAQRILATPALAEYIEGYDGDKDQSIKDISGFRLGNGKQIKAVFRVNGKRQERVIDYIARTGTGGRGFTGDVLYLDEAFAIKEAEMGALLPTLRAKSLVGNPQVWVTSSAGMADSVYLESLRRQGLEGSDPTLAYFEWSADDETIRDEDDPIEWDRDEWYRSNPSLGYLVSEDHMAKEIQQLSETSNGVEELRRELLGIWSTGAGKPIFNLGTWMNRKSTEEKIKLDKPCFAVDVSPDRSGASITVTGQHNGKYVTRVLYDDEGTGWVPGRLKSLVLEGVSKGDGKIPILAIGNSAAQSLESEFKKERLNVRWISTAQYAQACGNIYDMIYQDTMSHTGQPVLTNAVMALRRKDKGAGLFVWDKATPMNEIRAAVAMTVSTFGAKARKDAFADDSVATKNRNRSF